MHVFFPATIFSPGFETENLTKPDVCKRIEGPDEGCTPDQCAKALIRGVERGEFQITYEPVGNMLRNSRGIVPRNNLIIDTFWGLAGTVSRSLPSPLARGPRVWDTSGRAVAA